MAENEGFSGRASRVYKRRKTGFSTCESANADRRFLTFFGQGVFKAVGRARPGGGGRGVHAHPPPAPARRESARLEGSEQRRGVSRRGCWIGAGSALGSPPFRSARPPDRASRRRRYEHEESRPSPSLRGLSPMESLRGRKSLPASFGGGSAEGGERGAWGENLKGGGRVRRSWRIGMAGLSAARAGSAGLASGERGPARRGGALRAGRLAGSRTDCGPEPGRRRIEGGGGNAGAEGA